MNDGFQNNSSSIHQLWGNTYVLRAKHLPMNKNRQDIDDYQRKVVDSSSLDEPHGHRSAELAYSHKTS